MKLVEFLVTNVVYPDWIRIQWGTWILIRIRIRNPESAGCSLLRSEGFFCSLDVLYGGLGIAIFERKKIQLNFFPYFLVIKALDPNLLEMLDPDPDSMNPNPQHC